MEVNLLDGVTLGSLLPLGVTGDGLGLLCRRLMICADICFDCVGVQKLPGKSVLEPIGHRVRPDGPIVRTGGRAAFAMAAAAPIFATAHRPAAEIGRASCRERVCQYV